MITREQAKRLMLCRNYSLQVIGGMGMVKTAVSIELAAEQIHDILSNQGEYMDSVLGGAPETVWLNELIKTLSPVRKFVTAKIRDFFESEIVRLRYLANAPGTAIELREDLEVYYHEVFGESFTHPTDALNDEMCKAAACAEEPLAQGGGEVAVFFGLRNHQYTPAEAVLIIDYAKVFVEARTSDGE